MTATRADASSISKDTMHTVHSESPLDGFSRQIFRSLRRVDQRKWAHAYLQGLLATTGKKSLRRLATAISHDPSVVQSLRQFISLSPWDFDEVMEELTGWVVDRRPSPVWSIGRVVLPKRGDRSVGVHRYFDPSSGRTLNCQLGLGSFLCVDTAQVPVDWCLYLPTTWAQAPERRRDARIPDSEQHRPLWAQALRLVDRLSARMGSASSVVLVDMSDEPDAALLLHGLVERHRDFVVAVPPHLALLPVDEDTSTPVSARTLLSTQSPETAVVSLPDGRKRTKRIQTSLVRLPGSAPGRSPGSAYRLLTQMGPVRTTGPLWLTNLAHHTLSEVSSTAALHTGTTAVIGSMQQDFGLLDFEGRSFPGWYHYMALVSAAYAYQRLHGHTAVPSRDAARRMAQ